MRWASCCAKRSGAAAGLVLALAGGSCVSTRTPLAAEMLAIEVSVTGGESTGYGRVVATFTNVSASPMAFSETFGYGAFAWIGLRVRTAGGDAVEFYQEDVDLFEPPPYRCLRPGESVRWEIDLQRWRVQLGGRRLGDDVYSLRLAPGSYELQIQYADTGRRARRRCPPVTGIARSEWRSFEVLERAGCGLRTGVDDPQRSARRPPDTPGMNTSVVLKP